MTLETNSDQHPIGLTMAQIVRRIILPYQEPTVDGSTTRLARPKDEAPGLFERNRWPDGSYDALLDEIERSTWVADRRLLDACDNGCSRHEIEFLKEQSISRYDEYQRAKVLVMSLPCGKGGSYLNRKGTSELEFAPRTPDNTDHNRLMPHSVFFWALHEYGQEIPEWAPPNFHLLLTIAWLLDIFMEAKIENWKEVMVEEKKRPEDKVWFRSNDLKVQAVTDSIQNELSDYADISRTIKKHVSSAKLIIHSYWRIENPLKPGEIQSANRTLCGLARATIKAFADVDSALNIPLDSPKQIAVFINTKFTRPPGLSTEQVERCLEDCWE
jgi:hypothetical protein